MQVKVFGCAICLITGGAAYLASEFTGGEGFWKAVASIALSACGVLVLLLYQDMKREQSEAKAERERLRLLLEKRRR